MSTKIAVIGMGYVGIPAAALLADIDGFTVTGIQRRSKRSGWKIDYLNDGNCPIKNEPGLPELINRVVKEKGTFHVTDDMSIISEMDYVLIDVQTPTDKENTPRYESLKAVSHEVGKLLRNGTTIIIESTVAPGTTDYIVKPILESESRKKVEKDFYLSFAYERVMVGRLLYNIINYPRVVGGIGPVSTEKTAWLYRHIMKAPVVETTALTSETAKVVENTYRDINIAFANEVALACESLGVDVFEVRELVNNLPFIEGRGNPHRNLHVPGAGVGGHCLTKDPWLLIYGVKKYGTYLPPMLITENSRSVNKSMPSHMVDLLEDALEKAGHAGNDSIEIAVLGAAFIEDSDDSRNTPTADFISLLSSKGYTFRVHDPYVRPVEVEFLMTNNFEEAIKGANAIVILTAHTDYKKMDLKNVKEIMGTDNPVLIDGRKTLVPDDVINAGFIFRGIGRGMHNTGIEK